MKKYLFFITVSLIYIVCIGVFIINCNKKSSFVIESKIDISLKGKKKDFYASTIPVVKDNYSDQILVAETTSNNIGLNEQTEEVLAKNTSINESDNILENNENIEKEVLYTDITKEIIETNDTTINSEIDNSDEENVSILLENEFIIKDDNIKDDESKSIDSENNYFSPSGKYLGTTNIKVVDVSYYQKDIDWNKFASDSDCYGVILRLGYYETLDKKFERNITELKRLNIPYGIYLFSYASSLNGAKKEANFTNSMISKYDINPTLGIYYDIESWSTKTSNSNGITKQMYDEIIEYYVNSVSKYTDYKYKVKVYSGRWYAMNRLGDKSKKYVDWVAEYNSTCKYDGTYSMWQYTSKGSIPGIEGNVDISYIL